MAKALIEESALSFQINCRLGESDYFAASQICKTEKMSHAVLIRTLLKNFLQQQNTFFDRPSAWVGAKIAMLFFDRAAVVSHPG